MSSKAVLIFCAQAFLVQSALSQCTSRAAVDATGLAAPYGWTGPGVAYDAAPAVAYDGLAWAGRACDGIYPAVAPAIDFTPTSGGGLPVTSASAIPPTGISVVSENAYEGALAVAGELPFVGTTGVEGMVPTAGAGAINHACGNGVTAMESETTAFAPAVIANAAAIAPAVIAPEVAIAPAAAAIAPMAAAIAPAAVAITPAAATIAPTAAAFAPAAAAAFGPGAAAIAPAAAISPASPFAPGAGFGLGNKFGFRGCGGRGFMY